MKQIINLVLHDTHHLSMWLKIDFSKVKWTECGFPSNLFCCSLYLLMNVLSFQRKNGQINTLMKNHEKAFSDIKNYYNDITLNNLALINSLKVITLQSYFLHCLLFSWGNYLNK